MTASSDLGVGRSIRIREVGPRDGLQNERPVTTAAKLVMLQELVEGGAEQIEVTSFVSPVAVPALADADEVAAQLHRWPHVTWSALVANRRGADRAIAAGIDRIEYVLSASDGHSVANVRRDVAGSLALVPELARTVHAVGGMLEVVVATAWDCPFDGPTPPDVVQRLVAESLGAGADAICLADTIGTVTPARLTRLLDLVRDVAEGIDVALHLHNTRGSGLVSAYAALQAGVTQFDASIGGLGGCPFAPGATGNIATEELVYLCRDLGIDTGYRLDRLLDAARRIEQILGLSFASGLARAGDRQLVSTRTSQVQE